MLQVPTCYGAPMPDTTPTAVAAPPTPIIVCDKCLRACCLKGLFMCDDSRGAGTTTKTEAELIALGREHSDYWDGTYESKTL